MAHPDLKPLEGKYEILEKMAEGGMGAVYKVHHRLLEEVRVIKVIRPQLGENEESRARFLREARSAVRLRHPNIALLHDFTIAEDGTSFMVMEYIDGLNLVDLVRQSGRPSIKLILEVGMQALRALGYLHKNHFVHRDVSPDNIMVTRDVEGNRLVKLIDLGIAKPIESEQSLTSQGLFLGKVRYASPEQFGGLDGHAVVEPRSDLYSFGIVLYVMLTGKYPIQGKDHASLMAGHLFHPPVPFETTDLEGRVPESLRVTVMRALAKDPEERFASAEEFANALAYILSTWMETEEDDDALAATVLEPIAKPPATHGTTQDQLDHHFAAEPTPYPSAPIAPHTTPAAAPPPGLSAPDSQATTTTPTSPPTDRSTGSSALAIPPLPGSETSPPDTPPTIVEPVPAPAVAPPPPETPTLLQPPAATEESVPASRRRLALVLGAVAILGLFGAGFLVMRGGEEAANGTNTEAPALAEVSGRPSEPSETSAAAPEGQTETADQTPTDPSDSDLGAPPEAAGESAQEARPTQPSVRQPTATAPLSNAAPKPTSRSTSPPPATVAPPESSRDRDLDALADRLASGDESAQGDAKRAMEAALQELYASQGEAQGASAARLAPVAFESGKLALRNGESAQSAGDWLRAARSFRDATELFALAADEATAARSQGRSAAQQAAGALGDERAVLEAIEVYAQAQRRQAGTLAGGALPSVDASLGNRGAVRYEACTVQVSAPRATAQCRVSLGAGPTGQRVHFDLQKSGTRWSVVGQSAI